MEKRNSQLEQGQPMEHRSGLFCLCKLTEIDVNDRYSKTCLKWPLKNRKNKDLNRFSETIVWSSI